MHFQRYRFPQLQFLLVLCIHWGWMDHGVIGLDVIELEIHIPIQLHIDEERIVSSVANSGCHELQPHAAGC